MIWFCSEFILLGLAFFVILFSNLPFASIIRIGGVAGQKATKSNKQFWAPSTCKYAQNIFKSTLKSHSNNIFPSESHVTVTETMKTTGKFQDEKETKT